MSSKKTYKIQICLSDKVYIEEGELSWLSINDVVSYSFKNRVITYKVISGGGAEIIVPENALVIFTEN